jgi:hypothetical protein
MNHIVRVLLVIVLTVFILGIITSGAALSTDTPASEHTKAQVITTIAHAVIPSDHAGGVGTTSPITTLTGYAVTDLSPLQRLFISCLQSFRSAADNPNVNVVVLRDCP